MLEKHLQPRARFASSRKQVVGGDQRITVMMMRVAEFDVVDDMNVFVSSRNRIIRVFDLYSECLSICPA